VRVVELCLALDTLAGPVNTVAPAPATNREFTRVLGQVLGRPTLLPLPALAVRLLLGEMGQALLLDSARVLPERLERAGFRFRHPGLETALRAALAREPTGTG
jgi:NAD dependent epimerase/dehydratase family enzyme